MPAPPNVVVPILHLIEDEGNFADTSKAEAFFNRFNQTTSYHTLAVFGGQGTGKSTLLNKLFGTSFATMLEDGGRSQTTRGAFASLIRDSSSKENEEAVDPLLLIVDFEGTDGMERGEDQSFEKKLALFAVACADVVVINMFANEVGRFNAANLSLLRTVFELNLNVFQKIKKENNSNKPSSSPTTKNTLFFCIRDFTSGTLEGNSDVMTRALTSIWEKVTKPSGLEDAKIEDYFTLKFACLPHYVLQRDKFDLEVSLLKGAFLKNTDANSDESLQEQLDASDLSRSASTGMILNAATTYIFEGQPHCSTGIPIRDNVTYLSNVWDTVKNQKDLDIPSQRLLVAQLRSQEVSEELLTLFNKKIDDIHLELEAGIVRRGISRLLENLQKNYSEEFKEKMQLYMETSPAVGKALLAMEKTMKQKSREVFKKFALNLAKALLRSNDTAVLLLVNRAIDNMIPKLTEAWIDDIAVVASSTQNNNSSIFNVDGVSNTTSSAVSPRTPQLGAVGLDEESTKPSAVPAKSSHDEKEDSLSGSSDGNNMMMERKQSQLLGDVRKMNNMKARLSQVEVSKYVNKFWGFIMREIDAVVTELKGSVKKYQKEARSQANIDKDNNNNNNNNGQENNDNNNNNNKRDESGVIMLASTNTHGESSSPVESSDSLLREIGQAFVEDDAAVDLVFKNVTSGFEERVRERVRNMTADTSSTVSSYFERHLFQAEDGSTRHFTTKKALEDAYRLAHTGGLLLLACLTVFRGRYYPNIDLTRPSPVSSPKRGNDDSSNSNSEKDQQHQPNNSNHQDPTSQQLNSSQNVQMEVFMIHFTRAMEQFQVSYVLDESVIARRNEVSSSSSNNTTSSSSSTGSPSSSSAKLSSPSSTNKNDRRNSIVRSYEFPALLSASQNDETLVATVDPGVKALHEFNDRFVMLSHANFRHAFDMFQQNCSFTWELQVRQLERDAASGAPTWMLGLLAFFVLREAMYIFADPVLLIIVIVICYVFLREWIRGQYLKFLEVGPVQVTVPLKIGVDKVMEITKNISTGVGSNSADDNNKEKRE